MKKSQEKNDKLALVGNLFTYTNHLCECTLSNPVVNGEFRNELAIKVTDIEKRYSFAPRKGLLRTEDKKGVLESFVALKDDDINRLVKLINSFGFIVPLPLDGKIYTIDYEIIYGILDRFKKLALLIDEMKKINISASIDGARLDNIISLTSFLIFQNPLMIKLPNGDVLYKTIINPFYYRIRTYNSSSSIDPYELYNLNIDKRDTITEDFPLSPDCSESYEYNEHDLYNYFWSHENDLLEPDLIESKYENDAYIFYKEIFSNLHIKRINKNGIIIFNENFSNVYGSDKDMKSRLLNIARDTIKTEFDYALRNIHPTINVDTFSSDWIIPDFITALYFSLFYRPQKDIFRVCANPNCKGSGLFTVSDTDNKRKRYCCKKCQNSAAQTRYLATDEGKKKAAERRKNAKNNKDQQKMQ